MPNSHQSVKAALCCMLLGIMQSDEPMPINTEWFTRKLQERKLSQRGLAKLLGIDSSAVSLMFRGKQGISLEVAGQMAVILQTTTDQVLEAAGVPVVRDQRKVKVIGNMHGDGSVGLAAEGIQDMVEAPPGLPGDAVAIQCHTARTPQELVDGWLYFLSESHRSPEAAVGTFALCAIKNNGLHMAHVKRGYRSGTFNLADNAGHTMQNVELAWASPVFWIKTTA